MALLAYLRLYQEIQDGKPSIPFRESSIKRGGQLTRGYG